mgnify:CR=1 FL=1
MKKDNDKNGKNNGQNFLVGILILAIISCIITVLIYSLNSKPKEDDKTISYTDLIKQISDGNIKKVEMTTGSTSIKVTLKEKIKLNPKKDITILIPCLNEEKTIGICLKKAKQIIQQENLDAEILVVDNGCEDNSIKIAKKQGARVIKVDKKGYGNALRYGTIEAIRKICHNG